MSSKNLYTVAVYTTPMSFPLNFTVHSWIEISDRNTTDRYDLWAYPGLKCHSEHVGYVYKDIFPDHLGTTFSPIANVDDLTKRQTGKIFQTITGPTGSPTHKLFVAIKEKAFLYPGAHSYQMILGPSCNTYAQWLLNLVPEANLSLPWYAWGKSHNYAKSGG